MPYPPYPQPEKPRRPPPRVPPPRGRREWWMNRKAPPQWQREGLKRGRGLGMADRDEEQIADYREDEGLPPMREDEIFPGIGVAKPRPRPQEPRPRPVPEVPPMDSDRGRTPPKNADEFEGVRRRRRRQPGPPIGRKPLNA